MMIGDAIRDREKVRAAVEKRGLVSLMNDTKWRELVNAVKTRLPFPPAFQVQDVLSDQPQPELFEKDVHYVGDWIEGLSPFYSIEWIRVRPTLLKHQAILLPAEKLMWNHNSLRFFES